MRGQDKLLRPIDGQSLLARTVGRACATGWPVFVTLPALEAERHVALHGSPARIVDVEDAETGMAASFRAYLARIASPVATLVLPADMPDLTSADLMLLGEAFLAAGADRVHRATAHDGRPGHPVVFTAACVSRFADLTGDEGARRILPPDVVLVALPDTHALTDLDTPEAWQDWEARRG